MFFVTVIMSRLTIAENVLLKYRKQLLQNLDLNSTYILDTLFGEKVINELQYDAVKSKGTCYEKNATLLGYVACSGNRNFFAFCNALKDEYGWLSEAMLNEASEAGITADEEQNSMLQPGAISTFTSAPPPTEKDLMRLSTVLSKDNWHAVMVELGVPYSDIDRCKDSQKTAKMQCFQTFVIWLRKQGEDAKFSDIYTALVESEAPLECLNKLKEIVSKRKESASSQS